MGENYDGIQFRLNAEQINKYVMFLSVDGKPIQLPLDDQDKEGQQYTKQIIVEVQPPMSKAAAKTTDNQKSAVESMESVMIVNIIISYLSNSAMS